MDLTLEQVAAMAPDAASAAAGKKLASIKHWPELGRSAAALWGKCQGSAVYQVRIDLSNLGYNCSCPSRKFPCKHVLGLLTLTVQSPDALTAAAVAPAWVETWLEKRRTREEKTASQAADRPSPPVDDKARQKRAAKRGASVREGLERLDLWMKDLVRGGLAGVETRPPGFWEEQAKRLVDAQAPGLASRVARLAAIPRSSPDWTARLLTELGRLKLLTHACRRIDELEPGLASDVRQMMGWNVTQEELENEGERVSDTWVVAGQWIDEEERVRAQRSWVIGRQTGRSGLILQFSAGAQPFSESIVAGTEQQGTLVFYPGASRVRAKFVSRDGAVASVQGRLPGCDTIDAFLTAVSEMLSRQPWLGAFGGILRDVTVLRVGEAWLVRDSAGNALPLTGQNHWKSLALTGGYPCDLAGEWDGYRLRLLGLVVEGRHWSS